MMITRLRRGGHRLIDALTPAPPPRRRRPDAAGTGSPRQNGPQKLVVQRNASPRSVRLRSHSTANVTATSHRTPEHRHRTPHVARRRRRRRDAHLLNACPDRYSGDICYGRASAGIDREGERDTRTYPDLRHYGGVPAGDARRRDGRRACASHQEPSQDRSFGSRGRVLVTDCAAERLARGAAVHRDHGC